MKKTKFTKRQITSFATRLAKLNSSLWDVINYCEEILNEDIAKELRKESDSELLKQVAYVFNEKCQDGSAADTDLNGATLSSVCGLIEKIYEVEESSVK